MTPAPQEEDHHAHEIPLVVPPIVRDSSVQGGITITTATTTTARTLEEYKERYAASIADPAAFWAQEAVQRLTWYHPFGGTDETESTPTMSTTTGGFEHGDVTWFAGGKLNACFNAVDRHVLAGKGDALALIWEGDEVTEIRRITYAALQRHVSQIASALAASGVKRGDVVTIYMPMSTYRYD